MALSQQDLCNLDAAIASAELEVQVDGRRVKYRSTAELLQAREHVAGVLQNQAGSGRRNAFQFRFTTSRGD